MKKSNLKEPFVRIVKRDNIKVKNIIFIYSIAVIGGLLLSGFISMLFSGLVFDISISYEYKT